MDDIYIETSDSNYDVEENLENANVKTLLDPEIHVVEFLDTPVIAATAGQTRQVKIFLFCLVIRHD